MAKDATFDIVSQVDFQEVDNAVQQTKKEVSQRYDFKGIEVAIDVDDHSMKITTADDMHLKSVIDVLQSKFIKRQVPIDNLEYGKVEPAAGGSVRQIITIKQGIDKELAKKIAKDIKNTKLKVQTQYMDDKIRVSGKKIDDLQEVIAFLKNNNYEISLQYNNFRS